MMNISDLPFLGCLALFFTTICWLKMAERQGIPDGSHFLMAAIGLYATFQVPIPPVSERWDFLSWWGLPILATSPIIGIFLFHPAVNKIVFAAFRTVFLWLGTAALALEHPEIPEDHILLISCLVALLPALPWQIWAKWWKDARAKQQRKRQQRERSRELARQEAFKIEEQLRQEEMFQDALDRLQ
jgi:hypothetical protein